MTVREWVVEHTRRAPQRLVVAMLAALGPSGEADVTRTAEQCLAAAARDVERLVAKQQFGRAHALDLLAIDALTALAYEYESYAADSDEAIEQAAHRGIAILTQAALARV